MGLEATQTSREVSFCAHAILRSDLLVVPDASADPRFSANPLVTGPPHFRFYAGAPLVMPDGHVLGTLCVIDQVPRQLSPEQADALRTLSHQVVSELELRRGRVELESALMASEEFKNRLIDSSQDCIKVLDLEGRLLSMNQGGMQALEICELAPLLNSSWIDFWQGGDRAAAQAAVEKARGGGTGRFVGYFATVITHQPRWWDVVVSPIHDVQGKPEHLLAVSRDVTKHKLDQEALREAHVQVTRSEERVRLILDSTAEGIFGCDPEGTCLFCNPAAVRLLGYDDPSELLGKNMHALEHHTRADGSPYPIVEVESAINHPRRKCCKQPARPLVEWWDATESVRAFPRKTLRG